MLSRTFLCMFIYSAFAGILPKQTPLKLTAALMPESCCGPRMLRGTPFVGCVLMTHLHSCIYLNCATTKQNDLGLMLVQGPYSEFASLSKVA
uniref:Putative secreted protein n=1 Tax=Amblyomma triste TaxID=251400 RepID=A0A023G1K2_AMBTT